MKKFLKSSPLLVAILLVGFLVRLYKIDNPIADWHSWRQADTSAVTRNFFKYGVNPFLPRFDDFSDITGTGNFNPQGYRFVEFPIFNLIHYTFKFVFPFLSLEVWGRLTSIIASLFSAFLIYKIVFRHADKSSAFLSAFFFLFLPYNIYYSRAILPDPLMVTFYLASINFFDLWIIQPKNKFYFLSAIFGALSVLVKPVAIFFFLPMLYLALKKYGLKALKMPVLYYFLSIIFLPFFAWRLWELRHPEGIPPNLWLLNGNHIRFKGAFFHWIFGERIGSLILGQWGIYPLLSGLFVATSSQAFFVSWVFASLIYLFTFATGNVHHDYYQIPIIPSVAILLGLGVRHFWPKQKLIVTVALLFMFAFSWYSVRGYYQVNHWEIVAAGRAVDRLVPPDAKVVAPYTGDTAFLYQTNRPGFPFMTMPIKDMIDKFGIGYYVSVNYDDQTRAIMAKYTVIEENPSYVIVKLVEPRRP